jgi:hypothetical protein
MWDFRLQTLKKIKTTWFPLTIERSVSTTNVAATIEQELPSYITHVAACLLTICVPTYLFNTLFCRIFLVGGWLNLITHTL